MTRKFTGILGLAVLAPALLLAGEAGVPYCQAHCRAGDLKAQIRTLEGDIKRAEVEISGTKPIAADRLRQEVADKEKKLMALKDELAKVETKMAQAESR